MTDRRTFLLGLAGLAACTSTPSVESSTTTSATDPPTTEPSTTTSTGQPPTTEPVVGVEPIDPAPSDLTDESFDLGVASGDPTSTSVVLWTHARTASDAELVWEVATDDTFAVLVATGRVAATPFLDDAAPTKVRVDDLPAATTLWYRFRASGGTTATGRTRTLPDPGATVEQVRLAVSSCQSRATGRWAAHRDLAETDVDLVVWLGDYIYENDTSEGGAVAADLAGYVDKYRTYKADPLLQAAHAAHPWLLGTDDHEVANDYDASVDPARRAAAFTAWAAYQPVDLTPDGPRWRGVRFGDLVDVALLDTRSESDADSTLGDEQWAWLETGAADTSTRWLCVASPTLVSGLVDHRDEPLVDYGWDRAPGDRPRLAGLLADRTNAGSGAFIVSGDLHTSMTLQLEGAATEFMAPAISSAFPPDYAPLVGLLALFNPHLLQVEPTNGWMLVEVTPDEVTATHHFVAEVGDPESSVAAGPSFSVPASAS